MAGPYDHHMLACLNGERPFGRPWNLKPFVTRLSKHGSAQRNP